MSELVRDNVPDIIRSQGGSCDTHVATKDEYWEALIVKFRQEVHEFLVAPNEAELADVLELIDAITEAIGPERVQEIREEKARVKGTFSKRLILEDWK